MSKDNISSTPSHVFGRQVRRMRESLRPKVSQAELARRLTEHGLPTNQVGVSRIETGERDDVSINEVFAIAVALNVSPLFLLAGTYAGETVDIVPGMPVAPSLMAYWLRGERPPPGADEEAFFDNVPLDERLDRLGRGVAHLASSYQDVIEAKKRKDLDAEQDALADLKDEIERQLAGVKREERRHLKQQFEQKKGRR
jgi:transcriptional regulator with XRE-family HTH domain